MTIYVELLRQHESIRRLLQDNGWRLDRRRHGFTARHRAVRDEAAARQNLQALGLLTSSSLRIELRPLVGKADN
jgi:hypothetical protein